MLGYALEQCDCNPNNPDTDELAVVAILQDALAKLEAQDTTVRETY